MMLNGERFGRDTREEVELPVLRDRLIEVIGETMQPRYISFWLKDQS